MIIEFIQSRTNRYEVEHHNSWHAGQRYRKSACLPCSERHRWRRSVASWLIAPSNV